MFFRVRVLCLADGLLARALNNSTHAFSSPGLCFAGVLLLCVFLPASSRGEKVAGRIFLRLRVACEKVRQAGHG